MVEIYVRDPAAPINEARVMSFIKRATFGKRESKQRLWILAERREKQENKQRTKRNFVLH
jgi:hypothetical protein